jgi:hypothetical protein
MWDELAPFPLPELPFDGLSLDCDPQAPIAQITDATDAVARAFLIRDPSPNAVAIGCQKFVRGPEERSLAVEIPGAQGDCRVKLLL